MILKTGECLSKLTPFIHQRHLRIGAIYCEFGFKGWDRVAGGLLRVVISLYKSIRALVSDEIFQGLAHQSADGQVLGTSAFGGRIIRFRYPVTDVVGDTLKMGPGPFRSPATKTEIGLLT